MKRFSEQLHKKASTVKLQAAEKRELRERVVSYMEYHPLPAEMKKSKTLNKEVLATEAYRVVRIPFLSIAKYAAAAFVIILVVIPVMAERAVPGDGLYAVKVKFNEEVRSTLAFDTYQKVEWETERLNRRIAEARLLASEGRLTEEVEAEVAQAVKEHSEKAQKGIDELRIEDADEATLATIAFETTLEVHAVALKNIADEAEPEGDPVESLISIVIDESRIISTEANASSSVPSFDKLIARVEINTTRAYELLGTLTLTATDEQVAEVTRRLEDIERTIGEALELKDSEDEIARDMLVDSLERTQKLVVFMTEIEVAQTVEVEEIVPVILTEEEEQTETTDFQTEITDKLETIKSRVNLKSNVDLVEKAQVAIERIETLLAIIVSSTEFSEIKVLADEAIQFADDTLSFLLAVNEEVIEEPIIEDTSTSTPTTTEEIIIEEEVASTSVEEVEAPSVEELSSE